VVIPITLGSVAGNTRAVTLGPNGNLSGAAGGGPPQVTSFSSTDVAWQSSRTARCPDL